MIFKLHKTKNLLFVIVSLSFFLLISIFLIYSSLGDSISGWVSTFSDQAKQESYKQPDTQKPPHYSENCYANFEISDKNGDSDPERVFICENQISLYFFGCPTCADVPGHLNPVTLETTDQFPELFDWNGMRASLNISEQTISGLGSLIFIRPKTCGVTSCASAVSIKLVKGTQVIDFFRFKDRGRWGGTVEVFSQNPLVIKTEFDLLGVGCGGCRHNWINFYQWDNAREYMAVVNNKHKKQFLSLLQEYTKRDVRGCDIDGDNHSFTEIWKSASDLNMSLCPKDSLITNDQIKFFLQTKKAIELVISGENFDHQYIESIDLGL